MIGIVLLIALTNLFSVNCQIDQRNVVEYLQANNFTTLVNLIKTAGLASTLSTGGPLTIFAPTDDAFKKLPPSLLLQLQSDPNALTNLLKFHVTNGIAITPMFTNGATFTMLNNKTIHINTYKNNHLHALFKGDVKSVIFDNKFKVYITSQFHATTANGVPLPKTDTIVRNGVIHKVDSVLLPLEKSISEYLGEHDTEFQDLYAALVLEGLEKTLESGNFTIFAPIDTAFSTIINALPTISSDDQLFQKILKMHVVPGTYFAAGLTDGMKLTTLTGEKLTVTINSSGVFVNGAKVVEADQATTNGVVHAINAVLQPSHN